MRALSSGFFSSIAILFCSPALAFAALAQTRFEEILDKEYEIDAQLEIIQSIEHAEEELPRKKKQPIDKEKAEELAKDLASANLELRGLRDELTKLKEAYVENLANGKLDSEVEDDKLVREIQTAYCNPVFIEFSRSEWRSNYARFMIELSDRSRALVNVLKDDRLVAHERARLQALLRQNFWAAMLLIRDRREGASFSRTDRDNFRAGILAIGHTYDFLLYGFAAGIVLGPAAIPLGMVAAVGGLSASSELQENFPGQNKRWKRILAKTAPVFSPIGFFSSRLWIFGSKTKQWHHDLQDYLFRVFGGPKNIQELFKKHLEYAGLKEKALACSGVLGSLSDVESAIENNF